MVNSWIGTQWTYYGIVISPPHTHTRTHTDFLRNIFSSEFVSCLTKFSPSHFTELSLKKWDLDWAESYTATGLLSHQDTGYTQYNFIGQEQTIKNTICFSRFFLRAYKLPISIYLKGRNVDQVATFWTTLIGKIDWFSKSKLLCKPTHRTRNSWMYSYIFVSDISIFYDDVELLHFCIPCIIMIGIRKGMEFVLTELCPWA